MNEKRHEENVLQFQFYVCPSNYNKIGPHTFFSQKRVEDLKFKMHINKERTERTFKKPL